jgi:signal transduction histidine kinase
MPMVYVADMHTYEILLMNKHMKDSFGADFVGDTCWKGFRNRSEPCRHRTNDKLLGPDGKASGAYIWESQIPVTGRWYINQDRAIKWDGERLARLQIATDVNDVHSSSGHLLSLINDILDLSKVEAGKLEYKPEKVAIRALISNSLIVIKEKALKHEVKTCIKFDGIPEVIQADERKLKQILYNLLSNAVKFTPKGGRIDLIATFIFG